MTFVWHFSTVSLLAAAVGLLYAALFASDAAVIAALAWFIGVQFLIIGAVHLFLVATSGLPGAVYKQFQWLLFFAVGLSAVAGA